MNQAVAVDTVPTEHRRNGEIDVLETYFVKRLPW
jgi:hypothetical protein